MSGEKCSSVSYDPRAEMIISLRTQREYLLRAVRHQLRQLQEVKELIGNSRSSINHAAILENQFEALVDSLADKKQDLLEKERYFDAFTIASSASLSSLQSEQRNLSGALQTLDKIARDVQEIKNQTTNLSALDALITFVESNIQESQNLMKTKDALLKEWSSTKQAELVGHLKTIQENVKAYLDGLAGAGDGNLRIQTIKEVAQMASEHVSALKDAITDVTEKDKEVKSLRQEIENIRKEINTDQIVAKDEAVKVAFNVLLDRLTANDKNLDSKKYEGMRTGLSEMRNHLHHLKQVDDKITDIAKEIERITVSLLTNEQVLKKWMTKDHNTMQAEKEVLNDKISLIRTAVKKGARLDAAEMTGLHDQAQRLADKIVVISKAALDKEALDQKRNYLIDSLRKVCKKLGFDEKGQVSLSTEGDYTSSQLQKYDTLTQGMMVFRFGLDGRVESSTGISHEECGDMYEKISEELKDEYGVQTSFYLANSDEPLKMTKTEKDLPRASIKSQSTKGGR